MVLGAVWCPAERTGEISCRLRELKAEHGLSPGFEAKWTKVSPGRVLLYRSLLDYFFDDDHLHFRALIASGKSKLRHDQFAHDHDAWYYQLYFDMLKVILSPSARYRVYLDVKDTRSSAKIRRLHDVLCNNMYDFERHILERVQTVRSHEIEILQLTDLLIGAVSYANRGLSGSPAKVALVDRVRARSGYRLDRTTLLREEKVNLFRWTPAETAE
jgi:hypothetical protein